MKFFVFFLCFSFFLLKIFFCFYLNIYCLFFSRCFNSKNGQAAIYVEATVEDNVKKRIAEIQYDLQALPRGIKGYDPTEGNL